MSTQLSDGFSVEPFYDPDTADVRPTREVHVDILLGPDVFVNASVALGSPPDQVAKRVLGRSPKPKTTEWVLGRVEAMLAALPTFKKEALGPHMQLIRSLVEVVPLPDSIPPDQWVRGLVASARAAGYKRVVTDHPDLADKVEEDGIEFLSSEAWLFEQTLPPPPPPGANKS